MLHSGASASSARRDTPVASHRLLGSPVLWLAVSLVLMDLLARSARDSIYGAWTRGPVGQFLATERLVLGSGDGGRPSIVLAGSSRLRDAVAQYTLADHLGLPRGGVVNLGVSGGRPSDALAYYQRHHDVLGSAKWLIFAVEDWQLNAPSSSSPGDRYRQRASLAQRLRFPVWEHRPDLVLGWIWGLWDLRSPLRAMAGNLTKGSPFGAPVYLDDDGHVAAVDVAESSSDAELADRRLGGFTPWHEEIAALADLAEIAAADGANLRLVLLPLRRTYLDAVTERHADEDSRWRALAVGAIGGRAIDDLSDPRPWGLDETKHFADYGHLNRAGRAAFTAAFAHWLRDIGVGEP